MKLRIYIISLLLCAAFVSKVSAQEDKINGEVYTISDEDIQKLFDSDELFPNYQYNKVLVKDKTFAFSPDKTLKIRNQRGSITINNWEKSEVSITIRVSYTGLINRKSAKVLRETKVAFTDNNWSIVSESTAKNQANKFFYSFDYTINAPKNLKIDLQTTFGDIGIESISNASKIKCKFGDLQLNSSVPSGDIPLQLSLEFADDVHIGTVSHLDIEAKFSTIDIDKVEDIKTDTKFSKIRVDGETPLVSIDSKHDKMRWESVGDFTTNEMEFTTLQIEKLLKKLVLEDVRFGKIKVEEIAEDFEEIDIDSEFTPIQLLIGNSAYELDLGTKFGKVEIPKDAVVREKEKESNSLYLKAVKSGKGTSGSIKVRSKHAKISIK